MPILHVRNVPEELFRRLHELADSERRSLSAEVVVLLEKAVAGAGKVMSQAELLARIRKRRDSIRLPKDWPGVVQLIREDRDR